jgi:hypothetical protein
MAHMFARLRIADHISGIVARLTTGSGGRTLGRAGFAPAGRQTKFHEVIASSFPFDPHCLVALIFLYPDDQEIAVLSLHLLQACLVYINTLMLQQVLTDPQWLDKMTGEDYRALSPLLHQHVTPYGLFALDMSKRIPIEQTARIGKL